MKKAFIPKWGFYTIGGFLLFIGVTIGSLKIKSQTLSNLKELENIKIEDRLEYERNLRDKEFKDAQEFRRGLYQKIQEDREKPAKERRKLLESGFSPWDGSHKALEKYIKSTLRDPRSYEHVETRFTDNGEHIIVGTTFRAKNGFGGMNTGSIVVKASIDGKILGIITKDF
jgi:hypothetical protein